MENITKIIAECRYLAASRGNAIDKGNHELANKQYRKLVEIYEKIKDHAQEGQVALLSLLQDENEAVVCWAATHSLSFKEDMALRALEKISKNPSLTSFSAKMVIAQWKRGEFKLL